MYGEKTYCGFEDRPMKKFFIGLPEAAPGMSGFKKIKQQLMEWHLKGRIEEINRYF